MATTLAEAVAAFVSSGVPVAHVRFRDKRKPPFAEAYLNNSNTVTSRLRRASRTHWAKRTSPGKSEVASEPTKTS